MGTETMGKVLVAAKIENHDDLVVVGRGLMPAEQVRRIDVAQALIDTGATIVGMPRRLIEQLGLTPPARPGGGPQAAASTSKFIASST